MKIFYVIFFYILEFYEVLLIVIIYFDLFRKYHSLEINNLYNRKKFI